MICFVIIDEDPRTCGLCPPQGGRNMWPKTWEALKKARRAGTLNALSGQDSSKATLSCKHKVTKLSICATPCDGIPNMCEDDIDEKCEGPKISIILVLIFIASLAFIAFMSVCNQISSVNFIDISVKEVGNSKEMPRILGNLVTHKTLWKIKDAVISAKEHYACAAKLHSKQLVRDEYFMAAMGSNETSAFFYDCATNAITIRVLLAMAKYLPWLFEILRTECAQKISIITEHVIYLMVRYVDLTKDLLLLYIIWIRLGNYDASSFASMTFWILSFSILSSEIMSFIIMLVKCNFTGQKIKSKIIFTIITPLIPALFIYERLQQSLLAMREMMRHDHMETSSINLTPHEYEINKNLVQHIRKIRQLNLLSASVQCTENIFENVPQLTLVLLITLLSWTTSRTVENIDRLFVDENKYLGYILTLLTIMSLVRGQLSYMTAYKNGCQMGIIILLPCLLVGVLTR